MGDGTKTIELLILQLGIRIELGKKTLNYTKSGISNLRVIPSLIGAQLD